MKRSETYYHTAHTALLTDQNKALIYNEMFLSLGFHLANFFNDIACFEDVTQKRKGTVASLSTKVLLLFVQLKEYRGPQFIQVQTHGFLLAPLALFYFIFSLGVVCD